MTFEEIATKEDIAELRRLILESHRPQKNDDEDRYMDLKQAAAYIKIKPRTLGEYVRRNEIPYHRVGSGVRLSRADLDTYMLQHRVKSRAELDSIANNM